VALYALSEKLLILHDFTQDTGALLRALDSYKNKGNSEFSASDFTMENRGSADVNLAVNMEKLFGGRAIPISIPWIECTLRRGFGSDCRSSGAVLDVRTLCGLGKFPDQYRLAASAGDGHQVPEFNGDEGY